MSARASAQFKLQQTFTDTTAPGWTLSGSAFLSAPSIDSAGQGWLRLTDTGNNEKGLALDTSESFAGNVPVTVRFSFVSWGDQGADGITVFLYDSAQNMSGALTGWLLGVTVAAPAATLPSGWTSTATFPIRGDKCGAASGGPGRVPESLVLRGPLSAQDQYITGVPITGGIDNPGVVTRPEPKDNPADPHAGHARLHRHRTVPGGHRCALPDSIFQRVRTLCRSGEPQRGHQRQHRRFDQHS